MQDLWPHLRHHRPQRLGRRPLPVPVGPVALHGVCQLGVQEEGHRDLRDEVGASRCQIEAVSEGTHHEHLSGTGSCSIRLARSVGRGKVGSRPYRRFLRGSNFAVLVFIMPKSKEKIEFFRGSQIY